MKVYSNIMNSISLKNMMNAIFINSENSKTFDPRRLFIKPSCFIKP